MISSEFYQSQIQTAATVISGNGLKSLVLIKVEGHEEFKDNSFVNQGEMNMINKLIPLIKAKSNLSIITPYSA